MEYFLMGGTSLLRLDFRRLICRNGYDECEGQYQGFLESI